MMLHHVGSSSIWLETFGDDVDAFVMPGTEKGQWTCTGDTELVVYEQCKDKEAAFAFIEYMITGDGGSKWFKGTGKSLGTDNITSTPEYAANPFQAVSSQSIPIAGVLPPTDTVTEFINSVWSNTNQQALLGQVAPEDALKIMNQSLNGQKIQSFEYTGEGMRRVYENGQWTVGIKNYKPANDKSLFNELERHNETDELFVLISGACTLVYAEEMDGKMKFGAVSMEMGKVYNIPQGLWHNTITVPGTRMVLIEDPGTGMSNSDIYHLGAGEAGELRSLIP